MPKQRGSNFTLSEKKAFLDIIEKHKAAVDKRSGFVPLEQKQESWKRVAFEFNQITSRPREVDQLRCLLNNMRKKLKKNFVGDKYLTVIDEVNALREEIKNDTSQTNEAEQEDEYEIGMDPLGYENKFADPSVTIKVETLEPDFDESADGRSQTPPFIYPQIDIQTRSDTTAETIQQKEVQLLECKIMESKGNLEECQLRHFHMQQEHEQRVKILKLEIKHRTEEFEHKRNMWAIERRIKNAELRAKIISLPPK